MKVQYEEVNSLLWEMNEWYCDIIWQSDIHCYCYSRIDWPIADDKCRAASSSRQDCGRYWAGDLLILSSCLPHYSSTILAWKYFGFWYFILKFCSLQPAGLLRRLILWGLMMEGWIVCLLGSIWIRFLPKTKFFTQFAIREIVHK